MPTRSPTPIPAAMKPLASAATSSRNWRAVTFCQAVPPSLLFRRMTTRPGSRSARSKTESLRRAVAGISTTAGVLYSRMAPPCTGPHRVAGPYGDRGSEPASCSLLRAWHAPSPDPFPTTGLLTPAARFLPLVWRHAGSRDQRRARGGGPAASRGHGRGRAAVPWGPAAVRGLRRPRAGDLRGAVRRGVGDQGGRAAGGPALRRGAGLFRRAVAATRRRSRPAHPQRRRPPVRGAVRGAARTRLPDLRQR